MRINLRSIHTRLHILQLKKKKSKSSIHWWRRVLFRRSKSGYVTSHFPCKQERLPCKHFCTQASSESRAPFYFPIRAFAFAGFLFPSTVLTVEWDGQSSFAMPACFSSGSVHCCKVSTFFHRRAISSPPGHGSERYKMVSLPEHPKAAAWFRYLIQIREEQG